MESSSSKRRLSQTTSIESQTTPNSASSSVLTPLQVLYDIHYYIYNCHLQTFDPINMNAYPLIDSQLRGYRNYALLQRAARTLTDRGDLTQLLNQQEASLVA